MWGFPSLVGMEPSSPSLEVSVAVSLVSAPSFGLIPTKALVQTQFHQTAHVVE